MAKKSSPKDDYPLEAHVNVKGEWIPASQVEFIDISEDFQGYDLMTFRYDGEVRQSRITTRPS
jgi:hypothetical protein